MVVFPCRTVRNRTGATIRTQIMANLLYRPGPRPASRIRSGNPAPVLPHSQPILLPVINRGNSYPFSEIPDGTGFVGWRDSNSATSGLNVRRSIPLSYSPAHMRRHDRRICGMRSPSPHGVAEAGVSSTVPTRSGLRARPAPRPVQAQAGQDSNLQHTVPKTVVLPNCTTRLYAGLRVHPLAGRHPPARM